MNPGKNEAAKILPRAAGVNLVKIDHSEASQGRGLAELNRAEPYGSL